MAMTTSSRDIPRLSSLRRCCKLAVAAVGWLDLALKKRDCRAKACELLVKRLMQRRRRQDEQGHRVEEEKYQNTSESLPAVSGFTLAA